MAQLWLAALKRASGRFLVLKRADGLCADAEGHDLGLRRSRPAIVEGAGLARFCASALAA
jgi:hypothetical protein